MTIPQPPEGSVPGQPEHGTPQQPPTSQAPQGPPQLSREQLEAQYNGQGAEPQQPAAPQYQQPAQPQYQQPQQPPQYQQQPTQPQAPQYQQQYQQPAQPQYQQAAYQQQYPQYQAQQPQYQAQQPQGFAYGAPGPGEPFDGATDPEDLTRPLYGASFGQAIRRFFKNYVNFKGRASRSEYWWVQLFYGLVMLVPGIFYFIGLLMVVSDPYAFYGGPSGIGFVMLLISGILFFGFSLAILLPALGLAWRRLHDGNFAGPMYFLSFIPYVGSLIMIVFMILPSKPEGRRFDEVNIVRY
ncbi:DUF805 domain-containing protein [Leucobacter sp. HY1908]